MYSEFQETGKGYPQQLFSSLVVVQEKCCSVPSHKFMVTFQQELLFINFS